MQDPELKGFFVPEKIAEYRGFGGVRIEDDIIITKDGCEVIHIYTTKKIINFRLKDFFLFFGSTLI